MQSIKCPSCGEVKIHNIINFKPAKDMRCGLTNICRTCKQGIDREYSRKYREKNPEWKKFDNKRNEHLIRKLVKEYYYKYPIRVRALIEFRRALKNGKIKRFPCKVCGEEKVHGHHEDYNKPLKIIWLCSKHHRRVHGK